MPPSLHLGEDFRDRVSSLSSYSLISAHLRHNQQSWKRPNQLQFDIRAIANDLHQGNGLQDRVAASCKQVYNCTCNFTRRKKFESRSRLSWLPSSCVVVNGQIGCFVYLHDCSPWPWVESIFSKCLLPRFNFAVRACKIWMTEQQTIRTQERWYIEEQNHQ